MSLKMKKIESTYKKLLEELRRNPEMVKDICSLKVDSNNPPKDLNEKNRFDLAIALYNDFEKDDEFIIKYIFKEEFESLKAVIKNYPNAFELIAFLYTYNKSPEKVKDFYELKILNYDTFCGFEREHLLTGGIKETVDYLKTIDVEYANKIRQEIFQNNGEPMFNDAQIQDWWDYKKSEFSKFKFPTNLSEEIDFRIATKNPSELPNLLNQWSSQIETWNKKNLGKLLSVLNIIDDEVITINNLKQKSKLFEGELINLALTKKYLEALTNNKEFEFAFETIKSKLETNKNRMLETSLFFQLLTIMEECEDENLKAKTLNLLELNSKKLNQQILSRLKEKEKENDM